MVVVISFSRVLNMFLRGSYCLLGVFHLKTYFDAVRALKSFYVYLVYSSFLLQTIVTVPLDFLGVLWYNMSIECDIVVASMIVGHGLLIMRTRPYV
jgi:hypothetical protein